VYRFKKGKDNKTRFPNFKIPANWDQQLKNYNRYNNLQKRKLQKQITLTMYFPSLPFFYIRKIKKKSTKRSSILY